MTDTSRSPLLASSTRIALQNPGNMLERLSDHLAEHITVERFDNGARFAADFGIARAEISEDALAVTVESTDETGLSYLKLMVAEHVLEFADEQKPAIRWSGNGKVGELLPYFREMRVTAVADVTPRMRRIVLAGQNLDRFATGGLHVRLLFPPSGIAMPQWPVNGEDGRPRWPQGDAKPAARVYTIRHIDTAKGEVAIDMVLHGDPDEDHGPGAHFAWHARPGDIVGMTGPGGSIIGEASRYLLLGDETALPAIARMLEAMPASANVAAFVEVADDREEQPLPCAARLDLHWLHRGNADAGTTDLLAQVVRDHPWLKDGGDAPFLWACCEHAQTRTIRQYALGPLGLARDKCQAFTYWRRGIAGDDARKD